MRSTSIGSIYFSVLFALSWGLTLANGAAGYNGWILGLLAAFSAIFTVNIVLLFGYNGYRKDWDKIWGSDQATEQHPSEDKT